MAWTVWSYPIWMFHPSGKYSIKSFYAIVYNGGVVPIHTLAIWNLNVPPRIHVFLWLLANNKTLTRYNLHKQRHVEEKTSLFCTELEFVAHLFFECFVAHHIWQALSHIFCIRLGNVCESVARWWINNNKNSILNMFSSVTLWSLWSLRNELCF
jgi:hypothetical protein